MPRRSLAEVLVELESERGNRDTANDEVERLQARVRALPTSDNTPERQALNATTSDAMNARESARQKIAALLREREFLELQARHGTPAMQASVLYGTLLVGHCGALLFIAQTLLAEASPKEPNAFVLAGIPFGLGLLWLGGHALIALREPLGRFAMLLGGALFVIGGCVLGFAVVQESALRRGAPPAVSAVAAPVVSLNQDNPRTSDRPPTPPPPPRQPPPGPQ